jgi:hypothetical protein
MTADARGPLLPATFKQWFQRVCRLLHSEFVEQLRGVDGFVLGVKANAELLEDVFSGPNQHEFRALPIKEIRRIDRDEPATVKSLAQTLRQIRPTLFRQAHARRRLHLGVLHRDDVAVSLLIAIDGRELLPADHDEPVPFFAEWTKYSGS